MDIKDYIICDPKICGGDSVFKGTRIMVYLVLEMLEAGETIPDILKAYPQLTENHIKATFHYAAEVIKNGEYVPFAEIS